jgi:fructokinase
MTAQSAEGPIVVGLGELLWDCFPDLRRPGGAPANVAFHAGQLGCRGVVCSRVGRDAAGDELVEFLAAQGIATQWVQRDDAHPTGTVSVGMGRDRQHHFTIHENVAWDYLELNDGLKELMAAAAAVCFGTLAQRSPTTRRTILKALTAVGRDCLIVYDVNLRQEFYRRGWIEESLVAAQIVKLNLEEVAVLAELLGTGPPDPVPFARAIQEQFGVETVCVTRGKLGSLVIEKNGVHDVPAVTVKVADTVGAGDAFTAALIYTRLCGWPTARGAAFATRVGALVAQHPGAMPPLRDEIAALAAEFA